MDKIALVIAGATGLTGQASVQLALATAEVEYLYTLSRKPLLITAPKLIQTVSQDLCTPERVHTDSLPLVGVICLGTTIKKAGSKAQLRLIDVDLVVNTAMKMQSMGVGHIILVSCIGADANAFSHYLRCKGEMEDAITALKFEQTTFLQPGPLAGEREQSRPDEKIVQAIARVFKPLASSRLGNYLPIEADTVANAIMTSALHPGSEKVSRLTTSQMRALIQQQ